MHGDESSQRTQAAADLEIFMQRYQEGDNEAAALLISRLSPQIFQFFLAQVRDRSKAEDLLQDFWLRIHNARRTFRLGQPLLPWVYAIARRVRIDEYRKTRKFREHEFQTPALPELAAEPSSEQTSLPDLTDLLAKLPPAQREAILLLKVSGLSLQETARATGTTVGAVKQKAHRAYEKLRQMFGGEA